MRDTGDTRLGKAVTALVDAHPGNSGIHPMRDGRDAFAARYLLADAAERTLDVQYYIWRNDSSGILLFDALRRAADRGVRVRLLLDDINTAEIEGILAALDAHPNIELRLFNPFAQRERRAVSLATDFARLNRRMHNKSYTADNQVTVIGGRNIGDEYFSAASDVSFADLDVLAVGPVVHEVSIDFDRYWACDSAYPADRLLPPAKPEAVAQLAAEAARVTRTPTATAYIGALRESAFARDLVAARLPLEWAVARMVSDAPAKALGRAQPDELLPQKLRQILGHPARELDLVSPYFVPRAEFVGYLVSLAKQGVRIKILTNSLEATDVPAVHAGYAKRRRQLLENGIVLYELKRRPSMLAHGMESLAGSSGASLHAKTFAVDRSRIFVGSFNFDPRSADLNTEMGFIIDSPVLAQGVSTAFATSIPLNAYEVRLSDTGRLQWIERRDGATVVTHDKEPGASFWTRLSVKLLSVLPIEPLL